MENSKGKSLVIIGAGGFGREVKWLIERINQYAAETSGKGVWNFLGFIDDGMKPGTEIGSSVVLGGCEWLDKYGEDIYAACAVGAAGTRETILRKIQNNPKIHFPNLVDPSVLCSGSVSMGQGNIICAGTIFTVDIQIGDFCIINLDCTLGHDVKMEDFVTVYPGVNVSGKVTIGRRSEIGTGTKIIQDKRISSGVIIGAGSIVIHDISENCTAVGCPARPIKYHKPVSDEEKDK